MVGVQGEVAQPEQPEVGVGVTESQSRSKGSIWPIRRGLRARP